MANDVIGGIEKASQKVRPGSRVCKNYKPASHEPPVLVSLFVALALAQERGIQLQAPLKRKSIHEPIGSFSL
jgi:hypothetical protein